MGFSPRPLPKVIDRTDDPPVYSNYFGTANGRHHIDNLSCGWRQWLWKRRKKLVGPLRNVLRRPGQIVTRHDTIPNLSRTRVIGPTLSNGTDPESVLQWERHWIPIICHHLLWSWNTTGHGASWTSFSVTPTFFFLSFYLFLWKNKYW